MADRVMTIIESWADEAIRALDTDHEVGGWTIPMDEVVGARGLAMTTLDDAFEGYGRLIQAVADRTSWAACQLEIVFPDSEEIDISPPRLDASAAFDPFHPPRYRIVRRSLFSAPLRTQGFRRPVFVPGVSGAAVQAVYSCERAAQRTLFVGEEYVRAITLTHYPPELRLVRDIR